MTPWNCVFSEVHNVTSWNTVSITFTAVSTSYLKNIEWFFLICKLLWSKCSNTGNLIHFGSFRSSKSHCQFLKEMCLSFFLYLQYKNPCFIHFAWFVVLFFLKPNSVCLNNLQILQSIKKTIGWQDLAPHWAYNVNQGWEWYIAWLFCTAVCSLYFSDLSEIILGNRVLQQNIFLYLIRKLLNSQLQLMHVYSFVNRHSLLKVVYNI